MVVLNDATQHTTAVADVCNFGWVSQSDASFQRQHHRRDQSRQGRFVRVTGVRRRLRGWPMFEGNAGADADFRGGELKFGRGQLRNAPPASGCNHLADAYS